MKIAKQTAKKILIILLIVFGGFTLVGGSVFSIAMSVAGWDFSVMNTVEYKRETYKEIQEITNLEATFGSADIKVYFDESATQVRVEFAEKYTKHGKQLTEIAITEEDNTLKITQKRLTTVFTETSFKESDDLLVYLPLTRAYTMDIKASTGDIILYGNGNLTNLNLTTSTGEIFINGTITATEKADIQTSTGEIFIRKSLTAPNVEMKAGTGDIWLNQLSGETLYVTTSTGDVRNYNDGVLDFINLQFKVGTGDVDLRLAGLYTDYCVDIKTSTGKVFISGYPDTSKERTLFIRTSTGDIRGVYVEK